MSSKFGTNGVGAVDFAVPHKDFPVFATTVAFQRVSEREKYFAALSADSEREREREREREAGSLHSNGVSLNDLHNYDSTNTRVGRATRLQLQQYNDGVGIYALCWFAMVYGCLF